MLNLKGLGVSLPCYVTQDGIRVISGRGMQEALRLVDESPTSQQSGSRLGRLFGNKTFKSLILKDKTPGHFTPIKLSFKGKLIHGYKAETLVDICEIMLQAREQGQCKTGRLKIVADQCEILVRAFAKVGLTALVDEATGYQYDRARTALVEILEKFISKELRQWVKTFQDEFYQQIFRLKGWKMSEVSNRRPIIFGKITNDLVYERLAPNVLDELRRLTPRDSKGKLTNRLFQRLTEDVGHPKLKEHLASEIILMRIFPDGEWDAFYKALNIALPKQTKLPLFDGIDDATN